MNLITKTLALLSSLAIFLCIFRFFWNFLRLYRSARKLPGEFAANPIECILFALKGETDKYDDIAHRFIKQDTAFIKYWILNKFAFVTKDADFIKEVLKCQDMLDNRDIFKSFWHNYGLTALSGDLHKKHRKILNRAFTYKQLQLALQNFDEKSRKYIRLMEGQVGEFNSIDYTSAYSLESFAKAHLNYDMNAFKCDVLDAHLRYTSVTILSHFLVSLADSLSMHRTFSSKLCKTLTILDDFTDDVRRKHQLEKGKSSLIDLLLDPQNELSDKEIRDEIIMFSLGGTDTTLKSLSITLLLLAMHQDVQQKVFNEIEEISSSDPNENFTIEFLQKFSYLEMAIKESLRLFPVLPSPIRQASADVDLNGYLIPKDTIIHISIFAMHRDEKYWGRDAHLFRPERFEEELVNPHAFLPFSNGPRICIGNRYSMLSMKIFLINFLGSYKVNCSTKFEDIVCKHGFTLEIETGYNISVLKRG